MNYVIDPVYTRENGTVPSGTEQSHASCVNAKWSQMVPEVITLEEECVLNCKNPVFCGIWRVK